MFIRINVKRPDESPCYYSVLYLRWGHSEIQKQQPSSCFEFPTAKACHSLHSLCHAFPLILLIFTQFLSVLLSKRVPFVVLLSSGEQSVSLETILSTCIQLAAQVPFHIFFPIPSLWMSPSLFEITIRLINNLYFDVLKGVSAPWFAGGVLCNNVAAIYISIGEMVIAQQYSA